MGVNLKAPLEEKMTANSERVMKMSERLNITAILEKKNSKAIFKRN